VPYATKRTVTTSQNNTRNRTPHVAANLQRRQ